MQPIDLLPVPRPTTPLDHWREHRIDAVVWPAALVTPMPQYQLSWQKLKFNEANEAAIPEQRGIYAFVVSVETPLIPSHGYIVYVGITGARKLRTLRDRYGDYLRERRLGSKRPRILTMFKLWGEHLDFWFAPCPDATLDLEALERELNTLIIPPFVEKDFEAWARPQVKLLRTN